MPVHAGLEFADRIQLSDGDPPAERGGEFREAVADVAVSRHDHLLVPERPAVLAWVEEVKDGHQAGLARAVGVVEQCLGAGIVGGHDGNPQPACLLPFPERA